MKMSNMLVLRVGLIGLSMMMGTVMAQSSDNLSQQYCSNENTGSDFSPQSSIYMSMGKCFDICKADYAFAVVQYKQCWCSNYIPAAQDDTSQCSQACPGFPGDLCGNSNEGLYGYIPLYKSPSGTAGASSAPPTSSPPVSPFDASSGHYYPSHHYPSYHYHSSDLPFDPQSSEPPPQTSEPPPATSYVSHFVTRTQTVTTKKTQRPETEVVTSYVTPTPSSTPAPAPVSSDPTSSSAPATSSSSYVFSSSSSSPTSTPEPKTTVRVITKSGSVVTQTVTQTPIIIGSGSASSPEHMQVQQKSLSGGAIAGIVLGSLIGLAAILLAAFLLWRRKKRADSEEAAGAGAVKSRRPKRNTSVLSRTGLLARNRPQSMAETDDNFYGTGGNSVRHSMMFGAGATVEGVSPAGPLGGSNDNISSPASARRHSRPLVYDQRLNPSALFANADANGSRVSMQDQNDYSRPLGVANPDFRGSFDSR